MIHLHKPSSSEPTHSYEHFEVCTENEKLGIYDFTLKQGITHEDDFAMMSAVLRKTHDEHLVPLLHTMSGKI